MYHLLVGSLPFVPPPRTFCAPQLQSTCHYIVNHYVEIWLGRRGGGGGGGYGANNMRPLSWGGGGGGTKGKDPIGFDFHFT